MRKTAAQISSRLREIRKTLQNRKKWPTTIATKRQTHQVRDQVNHAPRAPAAGGEVVALDGKALRRARGRNDPVRTIVSAWATEHGLALGPSAVMDRSNEITAVPDLLRALELAGCIVTLDALHCQKTTAREIHEAHADYVLALKGNQSTAHGGVRAFLDDAILRAAPHLVKMETVEKGHGSSLRNGEVFAMPLRKSSAKTLGASICVVVMPFQSAPRACSGP